LVGRDEFEHRGEDRSGTTESQRTGAAGSKQPLTAITLDVRIRLPTRCSWRRSSRSWKLQSSALRPSVGHSR
jgi:hypothetical protein